MHKYFDWPLEYIRHAHPRYSTAQAIAAFPHYPPHPFPALQHTNAPSNAKNRDQRKQKAPCITPNPLNPKCGGPTLWTKRRLMRMIYVPCESFPALSSNALSFQSLTSGLFLTSSSQYKALLPQRASGRMPRLVAPSNSITVRRVSLTQSHTRHRVSRPIIVILNARIPHMQPTSTAALDRMSPPIDLS